MTRSMHNVQLDLTLLPCQQQLHSPRKDQPRGETGVKRLALSCRHKYIKTIVPPSCEGCISQTNPLSDLSVVSKARAYRPGRSFHLGRKCFLSGLWAHNDTDSASTLGATWHMTKFTLWKDLNFGFLGLHLWKDAKQLTKTVATEDQCQE